MKQELIRGLFQKFEEASTQINEVECWSARALSGLLGYFDWRNFLNVIEKAKIACSNSGQAINNHFVDVNKMVRIGST